MGVRQATFLDYDGFIEKFKPKKTTDDCYTPPAVYDAVLSYVDRHICPLEGHHIVRPFFPGGDYEGYGYLPGDIVIDNPPFSILSKILDFYIAGGVKFFLFGQNKTIFQYLFRRLTVILSNSSITYENGAVVNTSFLTNLCPPDIKVIADGRLYRTLAEAQATPPKRERYRYPDNVAIFSSFDRIIKAGEVFTVPAAECAHIKQLDCQRASGKAIYGSGILLSDRLAAERLAAERLAAERLAAERLAAERLADNSIEWELSERERKIIDTL